MATGAFKRIAPIYRSIGLAPSADLIGLRSAAAQKAFDSFDNQKKLVTLVRIALGLAKTEEENAFVAHFSGDDPNFAPRTGDREIGGLAAALLWEFIEQGKSLAASAAFMVATASFGGVRPYSDPDLNTYAKDFLIKSQTSEETKIFKDPTYRTRPKLKDEFDAMDARSSGNQFTACYPHIKSLLESGVAYTENGLKDLAVQLVAIIENQRQLNEEMAIHWWVLGGWSKDRQVSFASLKPEEAAIRSGKELADLTSSKIGWMTAPGMLDVVLKTGRANDVAPIPLAKAATAANVEWRRGWTNKVLESSEVGSILPLSLAMAIAADSNDATDWEPRFQRLTNIAPDIRIGVLNLATQLYNERLLAKTLIVS